MSLYPVAHSPTHTNTHLHTGRSPWGHNPKCIHLVAGIVLRGALNYSRLFRPETAGDNKGHSVTTHLSLTQTAASPSALSPGIITFHAIIKLALNKQFSGSCVREIFNGWSALVVDSGLVGCFAASILHVHPIKKVAKDLAQPATSIPTSPLCIFL